jgi:uncharacterized protein (TIGR00725 family)
MNITIFGGTKPRPGEPEYNEALRLGQLLARAGHTVITGGYMGTMEAVSRGAKEAGGHVVGITCEEIERWRKSYANAWVIEEVKLPTLHERMIALIERCDAAIALPGGIGTLAEISLLWNRMVVEATPRRKLILIGSGWQTSFAGLFQSLDGYFPLEHQAMLTFASTVEAAVSAVQNG